MTHQSWMEYAERIDKIRLFPRIFLIACTWFVFYVVWALVAKYMVMPPVAATGWESGFGAFVITALMGFLKLVYTTYSNSATDWSGKPPTTTSTLVSTTTATGTP